ncbi:MAG: SPFH domain-containing protein [Bacteroidales bacterium]|jgi:regulator of protease activity HflC (stomatin/prohibitin superfamily)
MKTKEEIYSGLKLSGIGMVIANFIFLIGIIVLVANVINSSTLSNGAIAFLLILSVFLFAVNILFWCGFMLIEPNEARVLIFFGKYVGTVKQNGFFWVNPFFSKKKLTLRARNLDAEPIKVNDKAGNPIMIGMVVVWKVVDTYKASFEIDNKSMMSSITGTGMRDSVSDKMKAYENFVQIQSDAALRYVAGLYPYDHLQSEESDELTLRSGGDEMNEILEKQINDRLAIAGIEVIEARVNYIAYAPEIAAVMLRRQQANAIIAAREKIVEGAVGMVQIALKKLSEENVIELDDDKKAAMVSNLMVVLCGEENAQPIVNTGTLYQ